jgi:hypothetical protein
VLPHFLLTVGLVLAPLLVGALSRIAAVAFMKESYTIRYSPACPLSSSKRGGERRALELLGMTPPSTCWCGTGSHPAA